MAELPLLPELLRFLDLEGWSWTGSMLAETQAWPELSGELLISEMDIVEMGKSRLTWFVGDSAMLGNGGRVTRVCN